MQLKEAQIVNFRSIKDLTIDFTPRCRVLVGVNEAGKTNILEALALLSKNRKPVADDVRVPAPNEGLLEQAYVWFVFSLDQDERKSIYQAIQPRVLCKNFSQAIVGHGAVNLNLEQVCDGVAEGLYSVDVQNQKKHASYWNFPTAYQIMEGWFQPAQSCPNQATLLLPDGTAKLIKSFALIHADSSANIEQGLLTKASAATVNQLVGKSIVEHVDKTLPECIFWRHSDEYLIPGRIPLESFAADPSTCLPLKHAFALADVADISEEIDAAKGRTNGVRNLLDRVGKRTTRCIREVWPEYKGISLDLRQNGSDLETSINDVHNLFDFSRRSDGFKRFIAFLLMISAPNKTRALKNVLILNDDPDAGMHPSGARHVRDELIRISASNYVVYATHSIFMIDRDQIGRHVIVQKKDEITTIEDANESSIVDEEVLYNALGFSFAEMLRDQNLVFEGWRDKNLFRVALSRVPAEYAEIKDAFKRVGICHVHGVKDVKRVAPVFELAGKGCIIISDSDRAAQEHQAEHRKHKGYGEWFRYDQILAKSRPETEEDFVKSEIIENAVSVVAATRPQLATASAFTVPGKGGVIGGLSSWLTKAGIEQGEKQKFIDSTKDAIFGELKPSHIRLSITIFSES